MARSDNVSVVIPNLNRTATLYSAVDSVLNQSHKSTEVIIVDDSKKEIHRQICQEYSDFEAVTVIRGDPPAGTYIGDAHARRKGVAHASGPYISFLDSDDTWKKERLAQHIHLWENYTNLGLTWDCWIETEESTDKSSLRGTVGDDLPTSALKSQGQPYKILRGNYIASRLWMEDNFIHMSSGFTTKQAIESIGGFPVKGYSDWQTWIRLASKYDVGVVEEALTMKNLGQNRLAHDPYHIARSQIDTYTSRIRLVSKIDLRKYHSFLEISRNCVHMTGEALSYLTNMVKYSADDRIS